MGVRAIQILIFLLGLLFCSGTLVKEPDDGSSSSPTSLLQMVKMDNASPSQKTVVPKLEKKSKRVLFVNTKLKSSDTMPQMDVVTPITAVPIVNPTTPTTPTPTTPTYNPVPTTPASPTTPTYNPVPTTPASPTTPTYNPVPTTPASPTTPTATPITNPYTSPPSSSGGQSWCIASQTASETALQVALDYACGYGGADCSQIQSGGSCYNPNTVRDHASYAFNDYYQKNPVPTSCDFGGTATITNTDPSTSTCHYPSTSINSTSSSVPNATNPTGSDVFGSVPPSPSGTTSMSTGTALFFTLTCLLMSPITLNLYK
ncbi:integumentary mucin A.1-like [Phoenix dactylifera]|uniref:Integumentary mucin A.1-like n=1 Tax=Phoenix dactylifera TaxID=42345 RepID=A0A8B7CER1_PHODC|nr:integumentary mucin A.1-like [Phoenix dactylifera]